MGSWRLRTKCLSSVLAALVCVSAGVAEAEPAPHKPTVISGSGVSSSGAFTASAAGAEFELPSRAHLRLSPNTTLRIFPVPQALQLTPGPKTMTWSFALQGGRVDVELPKTGRTAVLASMGRLSAVVTSGHVATLVTGDEAIVANTEGEVRTLLDEHWQTLRRAVRWLPGPSPPRPEKTVAHAVSSTCGYAE